MDAWMHDDLRRQALAFRRAPHEDHNRRPIRQKMRDLRTRRARRRWNSFMREARLAIR
jgi:hypothetical protein